MLSHGLVLEERMAGDILGQLLNLLMHSKTHRRYPLYVIRANIIDSINLGGNFVYVEDGSVVAFINWTFLSFKEIRSLGERGGVMSPELWRKSPADANLYIPELVAPFGHFRQIYQDMEKAFPYLDVAYAFSWKVSKPHSAPEPRVRRLKRAHAPIKN